MFEISKATYEVLDFTVWHGALASLPLHGRLTDAVVHRVRLPQPTCLRQATSKGRAGSRSTRLATTTSSSTRRFRLIHR